MVGAELGSEEGIGEGGMQLSAWIMFGFGCLVLYGGLGACLFIALRKRGER